MLHPIRSTWVLAIVVAVAACSDPVGPGAESHPFAQSSELAQLTSDVTAARETAGVQDARERLMPALESLPGSSALQVALERVETALSRGSAEEIAQQTRIAQSLLTQLAERASAGQEADLEAVRLVLDVVAP